MLMLTNDNLWEELSNQAAAVICGGDSREPFEANGSSEPQSKPMPIDSSKPMTTTPSCSLTPWESLCPKSIPIATAISEAYAKAVGDLAIVKTYTNTYTATGLAIAHSSSYSFAQG